MNANKRYKDSVFSFLFSEPDLLRELYCALEGVSLPSDVPVVINTLENVLFMELINDISFVIGGKLVVLIEHQSTINPNMALRLLMYIARVYEKMFREKRHLYSTKHLSVPRPEFFVLYNGSDPYPDEQVLRLSDSFAKAEILGLPPKDIPALDLEVRVFNINEGRNEEIGCRCRKLAEYSAFIAKARSYQLELKDKEKAMKATVKYCLKHDILKEFLEKHSAEVFNMLLTDEWNTEDAKQVWYAEGLEKGMEKGTVKGHAEVLGLLKQGLSVEEIEKRLEKMDS